MSLSTSKGRVPKQIEYYEAMTGHTSELYEIQKRGRIEVTNVRMNAKAGNILPVPPEATAVQDRRLIPEEGEEGAHNYMMRSKTWPSVEELVRMRRKEVTDWRGSPSRGIMVGSFAVLIIPFGWVLWVVWRKTMQRSV